MMIAGPTEVTAGSTRLEGSATAGWSRTSRPCSTALAAFGTSIAMPTRGLETTGLAPLKLSVASFAGMSFFDARREITRAQALAVHLLAQRDARALGRHGLGAAEQQRAVERVVDVGHVADRERVDRQGAAAEGDGQLGPARRDVLGDHGVAGRGAGEAADLDAGDVHARGDHAGRQRGRDRGRRAGPASARRRAPAAPPRRTPGPR